MLKSLLRDEHNQFLVVQDIAAISEILQQKERLLWLDLEKPTLAEFHMIQSEFNLHPLAIEDAMATHPRPKVDQYDNFYLVVFYLVSSSATDATNTPSKSTEPNAANVLGPGSDGRKEFHNLVKNAATRQAEPNSGVEQPWVMKSPVEAHRNGPATGVGPTADAVDNIGMTSLSDKIVLRELTMFMGENYLITVHDDPIPEFGEVARRWRQNVRLIKVKSAPDLTATAPVVPGCRHLNPEERITLEKHVGSTHDLPGIGPGTLPIVGATVGTAGYAESDNDPRPLAASPPPGDPSALDSIGNGGVYRQTKNGHKNSKNQHGAIGILLYSMLDTIVDEYFPVVDGIVDRVENLEEEIFERYNQAAIESIFSLKKDLLALRKVLAPERDVLNVLVRRDLPIFDQQTLLYFQDLYDHVVRITDSIDTYRDLLSSALDSFLSMQSNRLNITVQTLTAVSIILMSVAAVTGWYGMNFQFMPELSNPYGYITVISLVAVMVLLELIFFKRKGWL